MKIHWIVETISTFSGGHSYHAAIFTNTNNGKSFRAIVDASSSARMTVFYILCKQEYCFYSTENETTWKKYKELTKNLPYLTGSPEEMGSVILEKTA